MIANQIPISLYVHTPWCLHKCPYCDFNSHSLSAPPPEDAYIAALLEDFKAQLPAIQNRTIQTIFIGGGTPSLFSAESYVRLFKGLRQLTYIDANAEITLEANPGTVEQARFKAYRQSGINRLSLGIQSFQNDKLKALQRIHDANEAKLAVKTAKQAGFENFNLDLMFGLPNQSIDDGLYDLQTAIDLSPTHISWYQLTLEPHTAFFHNPPTLPADDAIWDLQLQGQALLQQSGYAQYEVSAYAKVNKQCRHNRNYWLFGDYIGIGAGAHGKITDFDNQTIHRRWNVKSPKDYLNPNNETIRGEKIVTLEERPLEFMMNTLRLNEEIPLNLFEQRTGISSSIIATTLQSATTQGLLAQSENHIAVTDQGRRYLNELLALF